MYSLGFLTHRVSDRYFGRCAIIELQVIARFDINSLTSRDPKDALRLASAGEIGRIRQREFNVRNNYALMLS